MNAPPKRGWMPGRPWSALVLAAALSSVGSAAAAQEFAQLRLRGGEKAYRERRYPEAADELRIAAFGLLDQPVFLEEALVYLALAQEAAGRKEEAEFTVGRFLEVERRFASYEKASIDPAARSAFESRFRRRLPSSVTARAAPPPAISPPAPTPAPPAAGNGSASSTMIGPPAPPRETPAVTITQSNAATDGTEAADGGIDTAPRVKRSVKPVVPRSALQGRAAGAVLLKVLVSERGEPLQVEIVRGITSELSEAAVAALKRWTFEPATKNGRPVEAWTTVAIQFQQ